MEIRDRIKSAGVYLLCFDLARQKDEERRRIFHEAISQPDVHPLRACLNAVLKAVVYETKGQLKSCLVGGARWTGIDLAIKGSRRLLGR